MKLPRPASSFDSQDEYDDYAAGRASDPDVELQVGFDDWVDVIAGRTDPRRLVATRRLKLKGSPRALWRARGIFPT